MFFYHDHAASWSAEIRFWLTNAATAFRDHLLWIALIWVLLALMWVVYLSSRGVR